MIRKKTQPLAILVVIGLCVLLMSPLTAFAETGEVTIAADTSIEVGDSLSVTVNYSASSLGRINGQLIYDTDLLKYVSGGTSDDAAGIVQLNTGLNGETAKSFVIHFKATGAGTDFLQVQTLDLYDADEADLGNPGASVKIKVAEAASPVKEDDSTVETPTTDTGTTDSDSDSSDTSTDNEKTPDTMWVYAGAMGITLILLIIAITVSRRKRK